MDILTREKQYADAQERTVLQHLEKIDPTLVSYALRLSEPSIKDLSTPERFITRQEALEPKDLVAVHLTNTFPESGIIHPKAIYDPDSLRFTIHFGINAVPPDITYFGWNWKARSYAILVPFDKLVARIEAFNPADTFVLDDLELPEGATIVKDKTDLKVGDPGKAKLLEADFSKPGTRLTGFQRVTYEEIIKMGYFPQEVNERGEWISWGSLISPNGRTFQGIEVWEEFCKRNGLQLAKGNPHASHWTGQMEDLAYYMDYYSKENRPDDLRGVIEETQEFLKKEEVPDKYKQALNVLLKKL